MDTSYLPISVLVKKSLDIGYFSFKVSHLKGIESHLELEESLTNAIYLRTC